MAVAENSCGWAGGVGALVMGVVAGEGCWEMGSVDRR